MTWKQKAKGGIDHDRQNGAPGSGDPATDEAIQEAVRRARAFHLKRVQSASLCRDRYLLRRVTVRRRPHRGGQLWLCAAARRRKRIRCGRHRRLRGGGDSDHDLHPMQKEKNDPHGGCGRNGGNKMKKRILSLLLCCVMLIGLLPTTAFAEEPLVCSCETACTVTT